MYICIIILFLLFSVIQQQKVKIVYDRTNKKRFRYIEEIFLNISMLILFLILALKSNNVGIDTNTYKIFYENTVKEYFVANTNIKWGIFSQFLYYFILNGLNKLGVSFFMAKFIIYLFSLWPIYIMIKKYSDNKVLSLLIWFCFGGFAIYASALRQVMAISFIYFSILIQMKANFKYKTLYSSLLILCAVLIHNTSIICVIPFIMSKLIKTSKYLKMYAVLGVVVGGVLPIRVFNFIIQKIDRMNYSVHIGQSSSILFVFVYICVLLFLLFSLDNEEVDMNTDVRTMYVYAFTSIIFIAISSQLYILSRLSYYTFLPLCIVITNGIKEMKKKKIGMIISISIVLLFIVYFFISLLSDYTGIYPYEFMWQSSK